MVRHGFDGRRSTRAALLVATGFAGLLGAGCDKDPAFCCSTAESCRAGGHESPLTPCTDPERPYCDDRGPDGTGLFGPGRTCIPQPMGQVCIGAADCPAELPLCLDHLCVECEENTDCQRADAPVCGETSHACEGCSTDDDCAGIPGAPRCLGVESVCVPCVSRADCGGDLPACVGNACAECADADDCSSAAPICEGGECRGCAADAECASDVCDESAGICREEASVVYVAADGVADGSCTRDAPCATFAQALAQVTSERNVIRAAPGTYTEQVEIDGTAVAIFADGATIQPPGSDQTVLAITGGAQVAIEGIAVTGAAGLGSPFGVTCTGTDSVLRLSRSTVIGNIGGGGVSITGCEFSLVNNVIALNGNTSSTVGGVLISQIGTGGLHEFSFNTVTGNIGAGNTIVGVACSLVAVPLVFSNNIVFGNFVSGTGAQVGEDDDCSWTYSDIGPGAVEGDGNISEDPDFVDIEGRDFHLQADSPARDAADPASDVARDIDGDQRPAGDRSDMGADETTATAE